MPRALTSAAVVLPAAAESLVFYERVSNHSIGDKTWFDASVEPKLRLTQAQRKVIASLSEKLLFGFRTDGSTAHKRKICEPTTAAENLTFLINTMQAILERRALYFPEERQLVETEVS